MDRYREQLDGTHQLLRLRRIKRLILLFLFILALALASYAMIAEGAALKPVYLPLDAFLSVALVLLLVAFVVNLAFHTLEIRYAKRDSQRYLLVQTSIRRAWPILVLGLLVGAVLLVPVTADAARGGLRDVRSGEIVGGGTFSYNVTNQDVFAFTRYLTGRIEAPNVNPNQDLPGEIRWDAGAQPFSIDRNTPFLFLFQTDRFHQYEITIRNPNSQPATFRVVLQGELKPAFTSVIPALFVLFGVASGAWIVYARPLRLKYREASIYSIQHVQEANRGERTFADYYRAQPPAGGPPAPVEAAPPPPPMPVPVVAPVPEMPEAPPEPERTPAVCLEEGSRLFSNGQYEVALALFDEALELEPTNVNALVAGASTLLRLNRPDEAMRQYDEVLRLDPRNAKALYDRAAVVESRREWASAADSWRDYLQVVPADVDARLRRAEAILNTGDRAAAVKALEEALFLSPSDPRIRARIDALTVNVAALLSKALVASASGRYDEAIADFDQILAVDPDNVNALVGKGVAFRRAGRGDDALALLDTALAKQPGNSAALRAKGAILEERRDFDRALDVYDDLLAWNPRDPEVWALQGSVLEKLNEPEEALASYREALKLEPANPEWRAKAAALESSKKGQEALIGELFEIKGMGPSRVRALLKAGFKTPEALRAATVDDLANAKGMTRKLAEDVYRHFHPEPAPPPPPPPA